MVTNGTRTCDGLIGPNLVVVGAYWSEINKQAPAPPVIQHAQQGPEVARQPLGRRAALAEEGQARKIITDSQARVTLWWRFNQLT